MQTILTDKAPAAIGPYCQGKKIDKIIITSGQIPINPETGEVSGDTIEKQTIQVIKNLSEVLKAGGSSLKNVVKTTCFLTNMQNFEAFNTIYSQYFTNQPARSCVAVKELPKKVLCEIEVISEINSPE